LVACAKSVAPAESASPAPSCAPPVPDPSARLVLQVYGAWDSPSFTIEIHPDGSILYRGGFQTRVGGPHAWNIDRPVATALFATAACGHPESWQRSYDWNMKDATAASITIDLGGDAGELRVLDNPICKDKRRSKEIAVRQHLPDDPEALCVLEDAIYAATGAAAYVECQREEDRLAGRCQGNPPW
jgi:hypothetical protein